ncbi:MAG TPA: hypothetical protein VKV04_23560, partial [Verrucomicrobiae bacterium]|nr:hypothetical protein [Verrucomicrobiae bacterium]
MQKNLIKTKNLLAISLIALLTPAYAATNTPARAYPSGLDVVIKIGNDLYTTLDPSFKKVVNPTVISVIQLDAPVIAPIQESRHGLLGQVSVSTGFISLLNHIAHAKAIDRVQPGYFNQYVADLARVNTGEIPPAPRGLEYGRYWTDDVMVEQTSLFNQMIGLTLAMNLSHHYLAHSVKYAAQMPDGKSAPINNLITANEWAATVECATLNSLDCALATAGAKTLFETIDQMPRRPAWTACIVPESVNI